MSVFVFLSPCFGVKPKIILKIERLMTDSVNVLREPASVPVGIPSVLHLLRFMSAAFSEAGRCGIFAVHCGIFWPLEL